MLLRILDIIILLIPVVIEFFKKERSEGQKTVEYVKEKQKEMVKTYEAILEEDSEKLTTARKMRLAVTSDILRKLREKDKPSG